MTIEEYYKSLKEQPHPSTAFVMRMSDLCHRKRLAVIRWCTGKTVPDRNIQEKIAAFVGVPADELFPKSINQSKVDSYGKPGTQRNKNR